MFWQSLQYSVMIEVVLQKIYIGLIMSSKLSDECKVSFTILRVLDANTFCLALSQIFSNVIAVNIVGALVKCKFAILNELLFIIMHCHMDAFPYYSVEQSTR